MSTIFLSEDANIITKTYLQDLGHKVCEISRTSAVYPAVASHPDIYLCNVSNTLVVSNEQLPFIKEQLTHIGTTYFTGTSLLGYEYPENVNYNAAQVGSTLIHNIRFTDPLILRLAVEDGLEVISVKQGYTKCNLVVVDDQSVITSDTGLEKALKPYGIDVLLISQGHIKLTGFPYGFLGGASGRVGKEIIFHGNLSAHPDFDKIVGFIENRGLFVKYFEDFPLEDIGSIIEVF